MSTTITVRDESRAIYIQNSYVLEDGKRHLQYHSRFDLEHYAKCTDCYEQHLDFNNEPEFQDDNDYDDGGDDE